MIGEMYTPPMYRDMMSSGMPMYEFDPTLMGMGSMYGGMGLGCYNTNYLGGVRLKPNLTQDSVQIMKAKDKDSANSVKNFGKMMLGLLGFTVVTTLLKGKKPFYSGWGKKLSSPFTRSASTGATGRTWYNPLSWFRKSTHTP